MCPSQSDLACYLVDTPLAGYEWLCDIPRHQELYSSSNISSTIYALNYSFIIRRWPATRIKLRPFLLEPLEGDNLSVRLSYGGRLTYLHLLRAECRFVLTHSKCGFGLTRCIPNIYWLGHSDQDHLRWTGTTVSRLQITHRF